MGLFNDILNKLGKKQEAEKPTPKPAAPSPAAKPVQPPSERPHPAAARPPREMPMVDVVSKLEGMASENPQELNWKVSIVDLLKLLDLDSSSEARKQMAIELGCPADKMEDSAAMNTWLHKDVLRRIARSGGNIPSELLD